MGMLTKEQQTQIEQDLQRQHHKVYLRCDDYLVVAEFQQTGKYTLGIAIFVNNVFKSKWFNPESPSEEALRFFRPVTLALYKSAEIKKLEKVFGKHESKKRGFYKK